MKERQPIYKGLPYQTFIASLLHRIAAGHFEGKSSTAARLFRLPLINEPDLAFFTNRTRRTRIHYRH